MESTSHPQIIKFNVYSSRRYRIEVMEFEDGTAFAQVCAKSSINMDAIDGRKPRRRQYVMKVVKDVPMGALLFGDRLIVDENCWKSFQEMCVDAGLILDFTNH